MAVLNNKQFFTLLAVSGVILLIVKNKAGSVVRSIDPTSNENVFYKGVSAITPQKSLGSFIYDLFH